MPIILHKIRLKYSCLGYDKNINIISKLKENVGSKEFSDEYIVFNKDADTYECINGCLAKKHRVRKNGSIEYSFYRCDCKIGFICNDVELISKFREIETFSAVKINLKIDELLDIDIEILVVSDNIINVNEIMAFREKLNIIGTPLKQAFGKEYLQEETEDWGKS